MDFLYVKHKNKRLVSSDRYNQNRLSNSIGILKSTSQILRLQYFYNSHKITDNPNPHNKKGFWFLRILKSDRRGSNPRSRPWQGRALPTTPLSHEAGDGNRTHVSSLEGWCSTIELHPHIAVGCFYFLFPSTILSIYQY